MAIGNGHGWGPRVDLADLEDLYAPQRVVKYRPTRAGIDNLALSSIDTFSIPGRGEFEVEFEGYFRVARAAPTTDEWATSEVYVNMIDIQLRGESELGPISVSINPEFVSAGQVFPAGAENAAAACRIAAGVSFEIPELEATVVNLEPVLLMNDGIDSVPPVEDPNGVAHLYRLPLFRSGEEASGPVAYLTSLRYTVGNYITEDQAEAFRNGKA